MTEPLQKSVLAGLGSALSLFILESVLSKDTVGLVLTLLVGVGTAIAVYLIEKFVRWPRN